MSGPVAQEKHAIWMISVIGATLKKLRDDAQDASLSPDGSQIAYRDSVTHELWTMESDGSNARLYLKPEQGFSVAGATWIAHGKRILYIAYKIASGQAEVRLESRDVKAGDPVVMVSNPRLSYFTPAGEGRLLCAISETGQNQYDSNLWDVRYDEETGKPRGGLRRLTDWTGFNFLFLELTADAKRLVFLNSRGQSDVYVGELAKGGDELKTPQRLTLDDRLDWPGGWSQDSKTVLLYSDRAGNFDIYKQGLNDRNATPIATGPEDKWSPQMSPDGKWVLYMQWTRNAEGVNANSGKLMRVPVSGGPPEVVTELKGYPGIASGGNVYATNGGFPNFRCPTRAGDCVLAERGSDEQVAFTAFDPQKGRKAGLIKLANPDLLSWDLSPDGARIASAVFDYKAADVQITPLNGGTPLKLSAAPFLRLGTVAWAADGKTLFLANFSSRGSAIIHMDLNGKSTMLFKASWDIISLSPSPDGRMLGFGPVITNGNAWTIAPFPN